MHHVCILPSMQAPLGMQRTQGAKAHITPRASMRGTLKKLGRHAMQRGTCSSSHSSVHTTATTSQTCEGAW